MIRCSVLLVSCYHTYLCYLIYVVIVTLPTNYFVSSDLALHTRSGLLMPFVGDSWTQRSGNQATEMRARARALNTRNAFTLMSAALPALLCHDFTMAFVSRRRCAVSRLVYKSITLSLMREPRLQLRPF